LLSCCFFSLFPHQKKPPLHTHAQHTHTRARARTHTHTHVHTSVYTHKHTTDAHSHARTHAHTHTHPQRSPRAGEFSNQNCYSEIKSADRPACGLLRPPLLQQIYYWHYCITRRHFGAFYTYLYVKAAKANSGLVCRHACCLHPCRLHSCSLHGYTIYSL